jgi:hypothetical protein
MDFKLPTNFMEDWYHSVPDLTSHRKLNEFFPFERSNESFMNTNFHKIYEQDLQFDEERRNVHPNEEVISFNAPLDPRYSGFHFDDFPSKSNQIDLSMNTQISQLPQRDFVSPLRNRRRLFKTKSSKEIRNEFKNGIKNYAKAIMAFCLNEIGRPYLEEKLQAYNTDYEEFKLFVINKKETIQNIDSFREVLIANLEDDSMTVRKCKEVFQGMSEIFIRDFAVNWIFSGGGLRHRETYLRMRQKMLRRVRKPELFTFLQ